MEINQHVTEQPMGQRKNSNGNQKIPQANKKNNKNPQDKVEM